MVINNAGDLKVLYPALDSSFSKTGPPRYKAAERNLRASHGIATEELR